MSEQFPHPSRVTSSGAPFYITGIAPTTDRRGPWHSIADIRAANRRIGNHWFDQVTLNFFESRVEQTIYGGRFFLSSERGPMPSSVRRWTVRAVKDTGEITTMGEFNVLSQETARAQARDYAQRLRNGETLKDEYGHDV